ncbi:hypothetical protein VP01_9852g1, partial [Puccinia sorghi]
QFSSLRELRTQIRNLNKMKEIIKWITSRIFLHNFLADLKNQWNDIYEKDVPYSAPVAEDEIGN